jgi:transposase
VESRRTPRGPRQHVVAYLGDVSKDFADGVRSVAAGTPSQGDLFSDRKPEWVEVDASRIRVERARCFGSSWLALELIRELGLDKFLASHLDEGRAEIPWSLTAQILVAERLLDARSELFIAAGGYEKTALSDLLGVPVPKVNDDRLYRALDRLLPKKSLLEAHLKEHLGTLFEISFDLLLYDITSTYFEGKSERNPQAKRGYSRDNRGDCKQVTIALVVSKEGLPLAYEVFDGNRTDVTTVEDIVELVESRYGKADRVWAMDRGMVSTKNIEFLKEGGRKYILGTPKASLKAFEKELLAGDWSEVYAGLEVKTCPAEGGEETFILCRSADRRLKDKAIMDRFEAHIQEGLIQITASCQARKQTPTTVACRVGRLLGQNTRAEHLFEFEVKTRPDGGAELIWSKRQEVRTWVELSQGCYMLRTNVTDWSGEDLWKAYMQLTQAETAFRICKNDLSLRPVWHQKEDRVQAHILVCFLAYVLWKTLDLKCRKAGIGNSARKVLEEIAAIQMVDVVLPTKSGQEIRKRCISVPEPPLAQLLHKLKLTLPTNLDLRKM